MDVVRVDVFLSERSVVPRRVLVRRRDDIAAFNDDSKHGKAQNEKGVDSVQDPR